MRNSTFTRTSSSTHRSALQRAFALVAIAVMAAVGLPAVATAANPAVITLTVHYQRPEADYATWNLWLWRNLGSGTDAEVNKAGVQFTGDDDYGKVVTVVIDNMDKYQDIGIIVRKGEWAAKDVSSDRFITKFTAEGTAEVWLRQADPTIYYEKPTGEMVIPEGNKQAKLAAPGFCGRDAAAPAGTGISLRFPPRGLRKRTPPLRAAGGKLHVLSM